MALTVKTVKMKNMKFDDSLFVPMKSKNIMIGALRAITTIIKELENDTITGLKIEQND